ncbi:MAG: hypothetical protein J5710_08410 [Treponema sp.]|nr:hypothetical protein [Treponema sp.]
MKNTCKQIIIACIFLFSAFVFCFTGCSDMTASQKESTELNQKQSIIIGGRITISGAVPDALTQTGNNSRSATSSFENNDIVYEVTATEVGNSSNKKTGSVSGNLYIIELDKIGDWTIEITGKIQVSGQDKYILTGTKTITNERLFNNTKSEDVVVHPDSSVTGVNGSINLELNAEQYTVIKLSGLPSNHKKSVASVVCTWSAFSDGTLDSSLVSKTLTFSENKTTISYSSVAPGSYNLSLLFKNDEGVDVYSCQTAVSVFPGFTTNTWVGRDDFISTDISNSQTEFILTDKLVKSYHTPVVQYPIVLWDSDTNPKRLEFNNPQAGGSIFDNIYGDEWRDDGLPLANSMYIRSFAIDPVTQNVYSLCEFRGTEMYRVNYQSIDAMPEKIWEQNLFEFSSPLTLSMCAYNEIVYIISAGNLYKIKTDVTPPQVTDYGLVSSSIPALSEYSYYKISATGENVYIVGFKMNKTYNDAYECDFKICCNKVILNDSEEITLVVQSSFSRSDHSNFGITDTQFNSFQRIGTANNYVIYLDDIQVIPAQDSDKEKICALISCKVVDRGEPYYNLAKGGILTFELNQAETAFTIVNRGTAQDPVYLAGYYTAGDLPTGGDEYNYFYGPTRFIARKPDELVIADEGSWMDMDLNKAYNKNRVVTVNLSDFSITDIKDVNFGFDSFCDPQAANGGQYLYYSDYYNTYGSTY